MRLILRERVWACVLVVWSITGCAGAGATAGGPAGDPCRPTATAAPPQGCGLVCRAELPVRLQDGLPLLTAWIGDRAATLLLDTGAATSSLTTDGAKRLGFARAVAAPGHIQGFGGEQDRAMVQIPRLAFGQLILTNVAVPVLVMGRSGDQTLPDGAVGDGILHQYDVDLDFPHGLVRLYQGRPCDGPLPGWASEDAVLPWTRPFANGWQVAIPVMLDGHTMQAMIDSGAETTVVGIPAALSTGVPQAELTSDLGTQLFGVGPAKVPGKRHRFATLTVGGQTVPDLETAVVALPPHTESIGMVLGADYLQTHKVWISYATGTVHVAHTW